MQLPRGVWTLAPAFLVLLQGILAPPQPRSPRKAAATNKQAQAPSARFLTFDEIRPVVQGFAGSDFPGSELTDSADWDPWIRQRDRDIRARVDAGTEDSISNLILYGVSYTALPRSESPDASLDASGQLTQTALARARALARAVQQKSRVDRVQFVRDFLSRKGVPAEHAAEYFSENLKRLAIEQRRYQEKLRKAQESGDADAVFATRGTLFETRGLSVDTSLLPNLALLETLRALRNKGVLQAGSIHRIAVAGPGLDFTDKRDGYDFYPLQSIQPFAALEAVVQLGLGNADSIDLFTLDLNAFVNSHLRKAAERASRGVPYVLQLPHDTLADWNPEAVEYWKHFGQTLGQEAPGRLPPSALQGVAVRSVRIPAKYVARLRALDLNIVSQTVSGSEGFDLVIATNILVYYNHFEQALAMTSIARMLNPGGMFLANNALPAQHDAALEYLGRRSSVFSKSGAYGDDIVVYRRR